MKKLVFILSMLIGYAYGQVCAAGDTVSANTVSLITYNSARVNGTLFEWTIAVTGLQLRYVRVGQTDTATASGSFSSALRNLTGLQANTQYRYYYRTICGSGTKNQTGVYTFTTLANTVTYTPMDAMGYQYKYVKVDSGLMVPRRDTTIGRAPNYGGSIVFKTSDSLFYGYNGLLWKPLAIDSFGIVNALNHKVDSVTVNSDSLFYWINGTSYGYVLPALANNWKTTGNSSTVAGTNYIGTNDAVALWLNTNGYNRLIIPAGGIASSTSSTDSVLVTKTDGVTLGKIAKTSLITNPSISSLTAATATNTINNGSYTQSWAWNGLTNNIGLELSSSSTATSSTGHTLLYAELSGANASSNKTTTTANFINGHTGTTSTNIAAIFSATGGTAANYAILVPAGSVGIGTQTPSYLLDVQGTFNVNNTISSIRANGTTIQIGDVPSVGNGTLLTVDDNNQKTTINKAVYLTGVTSGAGTKAVRINTSTGLLTYSDTTIGNAGTVTSIATGLGLSGGTITTSGTLLVDTSSASIISRQRAAATYLPLAGATYTTTTGTGLDLTSSTITTGNLMKLTNTGTAAGSNTKNVLAIISSGANGTASQTVTGQTISVTNTGTTNTNVGLNVTASGATNNYAALFTGNVGIGTTAPLAPLNILNTSEALRVSYDASNYSSLSASSSGNMLLGVNGTNKWGMSVSDGGTLYAVTGGTYNIGFDGSNSPKTIYAGSTGANNAFKGFLADATTSSLANAASVLVLRNTNTTANNFIKFGLNSNDNSATERNAVLIGAQVTARAAGSVTADLIFNTANAAAADEKMRIMSSGNVGIGTAAPNSTTHVNGSFATAYRAITALRTLDGTDHTIEVTTNTFTVTLPTAVGITGRQYVITNSGTGVTTIATTSSQTFVNVVATPTTLTLAQFSTVTVVSNGTNWIRTTSL